MAYATQAQLTPLRLTAAELTQLTLDVPSGNPATDAATTASVTAAALEEASGKVDSYCRARYQTPLQADDDIVGLTIDIALYLLFSRRRSSKMSETVRQRYEDAIGFLKDIAASRASLDQPVGDVAQSASAGPTISCRDHKLRFKDRHLEGFV